MTAPLPFTGERFIPEEKGAIWYEHWHRYCAAFGAARGKHVLDAACGEGYGSSLLAAVAQSVIGIDHDGAAIRHALSRYAQRPNLRHVQGSCTALPLADSSVDLVVSFETIEHLAGQDAMLEEFRRVLTPAGALIISSPNKAIYSEETGYVNKFHVRELTRDEFGAMLSARFPQQTWYGQRVLAHSMLWREGGPRTPVAEFVALNENRVEALSAPAPPMYFVVVCGDEAATLPQFAGLSVFDDGAQSLYRDYQRALLAEKRLYWDEIDARKIGEERLADLVATVDDLAEARSRVGDLEAALAHTQQAERMLAEARARLAFRESWRGWLRWPLHQLRCQFGKGGR